jgi:hypothetical protein
MYRRVIFGSCVHFFPSCFSLLGQSRAIEGWRKVVRSMPPCLKRICGGLILICELIRQHRIRIDFQYTYRRIGKRYVFYFYRRVGVDIYFIFMCWVIFMYGQSDIILHLWISLSIQRAVANRQALNVRPRRDPCKTHARIFNRCPI